MAINNGQYRETGKTEKGENRMDNPETSTRYRTETDKTRSTILKPRKIVPGTPLKTGGKPNTKRGAARSPPKQREPMCSQMRSNSSFL